MRILCLALLMFLVACDEPQKTKVIEQKAVTRTAQVPQKPQVLDEEDLLPAHMNPAEAYNKLCSKAGFKVSQNLIDIFNNFDSTSYSRRHYDFVHFLDGLTLGMGHWPQAEAKNFFASLGKNSEAKEQFIKQAIKAMQVLPASECRSYLKGKNCDASSIKALLNKTLFHPSYLKENYSRNCQLNSKYLCASGASLYYDLPWFKIVVARALRDKVVTKWQLGFFASDIIEPARKKALAAGLLDRSESTLIFSSFESSFKSYATKLLEVGKNNSYLEFGGKRYYWSKPEGIALPSDSQIQAWRMLISFRWYQYIKGQRAKRSKEKGCAYPLRDRQWHLYCKFLQKPVESYWPNAKIGSESCEKITDRIKKMGGCSKIRAREVKPSC